jgi:hypothetical protein
MSTIKAILAAALCIPFALAILLGIAGIGFVAIVASCYASIRARL